MSMKLFIMEGEYEDALSLYNQQKSEYDTAMKSYQSDYDQ